MAGNKNRGSGGLIYHWRHGWIPRTPTAALQKAHGSHKGASKLMDKHGIDGNLPGGKGKADASVAKSHPIGATVEARQPGIDNVTHGKVVGHTDAGMVRVQHKDRRGNDVTGTFNPSHTQVVKPGDNAPAAKTPHAAPHTLKPGEIATVRGIDHMGQPATFTGKVMANGEVSSFSKGRTTGGQPLRSISIERQDGSRRSNVVYVPDPSRSEQKRGAAKENESRAKVRDLPAEGNFSRSHSETFMGEKITVRKTEQGKHETLINGEPFSSGYGSRNKHAVAELDQARKSIETMKSSHDPKYRGLYGMKSDKPAAAPVGIMSRPSVLDSMPSVAPRNAQMRGEHVVTAKEAAANRTAMKDMSKRAEDTLKAAQKDSTGKQLLDVAKQGQGTSARTAIVRAAEDVGQGNHDQARKRLDAALADARAMGPAYPGDKTHLADIRALNAARGVLGGSSGQAGSAHAARAAELRAAAAKKRADADRIANGAGVNDRAAAMLSGKTHQRQVARDDSSLRRFAETTRRADALEAQARTAEGRVAREQEKQRAANLDLKPSDVTPGDMVLHNGRLQIVTKVNKTTVNVPSGYSWDDKVPLSKVTRHVPLSTQSDSAIRSAFDRTTDAKVKSALRAELLRRGLSAA